MSFIPLAAAGPPSITNVYTLYAAQTICMCAHLFIILNIYIFNL